MNEYQAMLRRLAKSESADIIANTSIEHARSVAAALFETATSSVDILSPTFDSELYDSSEVVDAACIFVRKRGTRLRLITTTETEEAASDFRSSIMSLCRTEETKFKLYINNNPGQLQFICADNRALRFQSNREEVAFASFNRPDYAEKLTSIFEQLLNGSREVIREYA